MLQINMNTIPTLYHTNYHSAVLSLKCQALDKEAWCHAGHLLHQLYEFLFSYLNQKVQLYVGLMKFLFFMMYLKSIILKLLEM